VLLAVVAACGTSNTNTTVVQCGAGTKIENGTCVAVASDAGSSGSTSGGSSTSGGPRVDGAVPVEDAGGEPVDAGVDVDPATQDDPCPVPGPDVEIVNCDAKCGPLHEACATQRCPAKGDVGWARDVINSWSLNGMEPPKKFILRMPADPAAVFGACDPTAMLTAEHMRPQPTFAARALILWPSSLAGVYPQMVIAATGYLGRIMTNNSPDGTRLSVQPIPRARPTSGSLINREFASCQKFNPEALTNEVFPAPSQFAVFLYTNTAQPARNLVINFLQTATCTGAP
jgi:hypothetical protein